MWPDSLGQQRQQHWSQLSADQYPFTTNATSWTTLVANPLANVPSTFQGRSTPVSNTIITGKPPSYPRTNLNGQVGLQPGVPGVARPVPFQPGLATRDVSPTMMNPFIQSLGLHDAALEQKIQEEMQNLFAFFQELRSKDLAEIHNLHAQIQSRDDQILRLQTSQSAGVNTTPQSKQPSQSTSPSHAYLQAAAAAHQAEPAVAAAHGSSQPSPAGTSGSPAPAGTQALAGSSSSPAPPGTQALAGEPRQLHIQVQRPQSKAAVPRSRSMKRTPAGPLPVNLVFLPAHVGPSKPFLSWYARLATSFKQHRTRWLAITWLVIFLLAVALLVGLLVPWPSKKDNTDTTPPTVELPSGGVSPATGPFNITVQVRVSKVSTVYFVLLPSSSLTFSRRRLAAEQQQAHHPDQHLQHQQQGGRWPGSRDGVHEEQHRLKQHEEEQHDVHEEQHDDAQHDETQHDDVLAVPHQDQQVPQLQPQLQPHPQLQEEKEQEEEEEEMHLAAGSLPHHQNPVEETLVHPHVADQLHPHVADQLHPEAMRVAARKLLAPSPVDLTKVTAAEVIEVADMRISSGSRGSDAAARLAAAASACGLRRLPA
eukprot:CAMPEP_0202907858 /NCGR_PEP_ID=MMETSP1392-20130828/44059_1 /ASSEMBLY_ACC=CAM_ASM_000868 /TAXON_ID=225041 /ORGANISM="Chlamydomonas chlamydogama, Strain SAG 11-48b" /LENGTH=592 /DNA_ID=CAMNT_0049596929 /DNA_START=417 /DNA_END=2192 /DNA_ORIENTATION=-